MTCRVCCEGCSRLPFIVVFASFIQHFGLAIGSHDAFIQDSNLRRRRRSHDALIQGNAACMRKTGGRCDFLPCRTEHGQTLCVEGHCLCSAGHCGDIYGRCSTGPAQDLGRFSIRSLKPTSSHAKYFGLISASDGMVVLAATNDSTPEWRLVVDKAGQGYVRLESARYPGKVLAIHARGRKQYNTLEARLRSDVPVEGRAKSPAPIPQASHARGQVHGASPTHTDTSPRALAYDTGRRRRRSSHMDNTHAESVALNEWANQSAGTHPTPELMLLQKAGRTFRRFSHGEHKHGLSSINDASHGETSSTEVVFESNGVSPTLALISTSSVSDASDAQLFTELVDILTLEPIEATFQLRHSHRGLELWDPWKGVAVSSAYPPSWFYPGSEDPPGRGVTQCLPTGLLSSGCQGREVLAFEPDIPRWVVSHQERLRISKPWSSHWWQSPFYAALVFMGLCASACVAKVLTPAYTKT